jgi:hypothetical protein
MDIPALVRSMVLPARGVKAVRLVGSRKRGQAGPLSDWDFAIESTNPEACAQDLPDHAKTASPLAAQWDRLGQTRCFMLILSGPTKVDLILDTTHIPEPPWQVSASTLPAIDAHFWDWVLWIASKDLAHGDEIVRAELVKLSRHLLRPMGSHYAPTSVASAVARYRRARHAQESLWDSLRNPELEKEVVAGLRRHGYAV